MDTNALVAQLSPLLLQALGVIGTALLAWIGTAVQARTNTVKLDSAVNRIQTGMTNAALSAALTSPTATPGEIAKSVIKYAHEELPDAMKLASPSQAAQSRMSLAKATQALATVAQMSAAQKQPFTTS